MVETMALLAEISDKMPTLATLWGLWFTIGLVLAGVTLWLSLIRLWIGAVIVVITACLGVLAASPDSAMDPAIVRELGSGYLFQQRLASFVPFSLALIIYGIVVRMRRHNPG